LLRLLGRILEQLLEKLHQNKNDHVLTWMTIVPVIAEPVVIFGDTYVWHFGYINAGVVCVKEFNKLKRKILRKKKKGRKERYQNMKKRRNLITFIHISMFFCQYFLYYFFLKKILV
jgi:hypothetical protein